MLEQRIWWMLKFVVWLRRSPTNLNSLRGSGALGRAESWARAMLAGAVASGLPEAPREGSATVGRTTCAKSWGTEAADISLAFFGR